MKSTFFVIIFFVLSPIMYGQINVAGNILDTKGIPIPGVNILNLSKNIHTHSDEDGFFEIDTKIGDTLQLTHMSYDAKRYIVEGIEELLEIRLEKIAVSLEEIVITNNVNTLSLISDFDVETTPVNSSQDILRKVPGLFIGQHAGGGKAEQIFLRGFDIDHGTDINISVDGIAVNMVSHAHGQGYSDLHFVIPETIDNIDFGKGPYYEDKGNFATAGFVGFKTKNELANSTIKAEIGQFNTQRLLGMFNLLNKNDQSAYVASEYLTTDGPYDSPQNFNRINLFGKYNVLLNKKDRIGVTASYFSSSWEASGQIPNRAVESGLIGRFGAIDDTEGGETSRTNISVNYDKVIDENSFLKNNVYFSKTDFELYSNFTFFLEDPINGDQIRQKEDRTIYGLKSEYNKDFTLNEIDGTWSAGINLRNDQNKDVELSRTLNRTEILEQIQLGDINETNLGGFIGAKLHLNKWSFHPSVRIDYFDFMYTDFLQPTFTTESNTEAIVSPNFNVFYNPSKGLQLYLKTGKGFHSNDTRVVINEDDSDVLPAAYGFDVGYIWKPRSNMFLNMAYWYLFLEQEFVYVGDAGIVEPIGRTRRQGVELSYRYQPIPSLSWNLDMNYTYARAIDEENGQDYIPLAPEFTLVSGLNFNHKSGFYSNVNLRYLMDRAANEDNSIVAEGYTVVDLNVGYKWKNFDFGIQIQNLFDTEWNETQFATESRLQNELESVEEIHFTPGTPFFGKAFIQYKF